MYVVADERDLIRLRTRHRKVDVYRYQAQVSPENARKLLVDMLQRVNKLAVKPEFYDTLTNNCTTNIVDHVNNIQPGRIPWGRDVLLSGRSDRLAYNLGLLDNSIPFEQLKSRARINVLADTYYDAEDFSQRIRGRSAEDIADSAQADDLETPWVARPTADPANASAEESPAEESPLAGEKPPP